MVNRKSAFSRDMAPWYLTKKISFSSYIIFTFGHCKIGILNKCFQISTHHTWCESSKESHFRKYYNPAKLQINTFYSTWMRQVKCISNKTKNIQKWANVYTDTGLIDKSFIVASWQSTTQIGSVLLCFTVFGGINNASIMITLSC